VDGEETVAPFAGVVMTTPRGGGPPPVVETAFDMWFKIDGLPTAWT
jgi:hypothetical protein